MVQILVFVGRLAAVKVLCHTYNIICLALSLCLWVASGSELIVA